jgi:Sulfatase
MRLVQEASDVQEKDQTSVTAGGLALAVALTVALASFGLSEWNKRLILHSNSFGQAIRLNLVDKILFCFTFFLEIVVLIGGLGIVLTRLFRSWRPIGWVAPLAVGGTYLIEEIGRYRLLEYFKNGLTVALLRELGGGDLKAALVYGESELLRLVPVVVLTLLLLCGGIFLVRSHGASAVLLRMSRVARPLEPVKPLLRLILFLIAVLMMIALGFPITNRALSTSFAHQVFAVPLDFLTDFDFDGYGLLDQPTDFAPFDRTRHPYAVEIPGNGIDEDGIGGDLPRLLPEPGSGTWDASKLVRRNVVLIVLESARADLIEPSTIIPMPVLENVPGFRFELISHAALTAPSVTAIMRGSIFEDHGTTLVDRFNQLGYQTVVFSGQSERFGGIDESAGFERALVYRDANDYPAEARLLPWAVEHWGIAIPSTQVVSSFGDWLDARKPGPFFAYLNFQEMHYPYSYPKTPAILSGPIPRNEISSRNRERVVRTYQNAARVVDNSIGAVLDGLKRRGELADTLILIVGDHGEELFEHGTVGHGTDINFSQVRTIGKLINSAWQPPAVPIGSSEIPVLLFNSLLANPANAQPLQGSAFCYVGGFRKPEQIGLVTTTGLVRYDFLKGVWEGQEHPDSPFKPHAPVDLVAHTWESIVIWSNAK